MSGVQGVSLHGSRESTYKAGTISERGLLTQLAIAASTEYDSNSTHKKLSYRRVTARCVLSVVILPITTQQCRNYLYDKS